MNVNERLEWAIRKKGIEKKQLAELTGYSKGYIFKIINNERSMTAEFAKKIAPYLGVAPEYLLGDTVEPYSLKNTDDEKNIWDKQQFLFNPLQELLNNIGVEIETFVSIGNMKFNHTAYGWNSEDQYLTDEELTNLIVKKRGFPVNYGIILSSTCGDEKYMSYKEFLQWQQDLINEIGNTVKKKCEFVKTPVLDKISADSVCKAIDI